VHLKRWITGLIALPFLIFIIYWGGILFALLISVAGVISLWEYFRIVYHAESKIQFNPITLWGYVICLVIIWTTHAVGMQLNMWIIAISLIFSAFISLFQFKSDPGVLEIIRKQLQGIVYIPLLLSFLIVIRNTPSGMVWIACILAVIFAGDISAFYSGSYLGRHKLCPAVSPGKTIEGSVGGLAGNLVVGLLVKYFFLPELSWSTSILFFLALGAAGQVGDLFESELKRFSSVKDSSGVLPGHGGFLDRIDALLFASPVAFVFIAYLL
jgi:phosphatidate cytidylyltransferase